MADAFALTDLISTSQAAQLLRVSTEQIRALANGGRLRVVAYIDRGAQKQRLFLRDDVRALASQREEILRTRADRVCISDIFRIRVHEVRREGTAQWQLARLGGIDASQFSRIVAGSLKVERLDERIVKIGEELGLEPDECFEPEAPTSGEAA